MRRVPRPITSVNRGVSFKRTYWALNWAFSTASTPGFYRRIAPSLNTLPNVNEYQALFDEYKLTGMKITFHPRFGTSVLDQNVNSAPFTNQFYLSYAVDTRSDVAFQPTGTYGSAAYNTFLEYAGSAAKTRSLNKPISVFWRPKVQSELSSANYKMVTPGWLSLNNAADMAMQSLWVFIHDYNFSAANVGQVGLDVQYTYYFKARGYA